MSSRTLSPKIGVLAIGEGSIYGRSERRIVSTCDRDAQSGPSHGGHSKGPHREAYADARAAAGAGTSEQLYSDAINGAGLAMHWAQRAASVDQGSATVRPASTNEIVAGCL